MITTSRNQFIASHVTEEMKSALRLEAHKETNGSVSLLIFRIVWNWLVNRGHALKEVV